MRDGAWSRTALAARAKSTSLPESLLIFAVRPDRNQPGITLEHFRKLQDPLYRAAQKIERDPIAAGVGEVDDCTQNNVHLSASFRKPLHLSATPFNITM